jgi:hypothetical protein
VRKFLLVVVLAAGCASYQAPASKEYMAVGMNRAKIVMAASSWASSEFAATGLKTIYNEPAEGKYIIRARVDVPTSTGTWKHVIIIHIEARDGTYGFRWEDAADCRSMLLCGDLEKAMAVIDKSLNKYINNKQ